MSLFNKIKDNIKVIVNDYASSVDGLAYDESWFANVTVEPPKDASHGEMSTNVALVMAKAFKKPPRKIAGSLIKDIENIDLVADVSVAGAGFINIRFSPEFWQNELAVILSSGLKYGDSQLGAGQKINIEYVSANPTGPMHIGHARGAVFGETLANLLVKSGFDVVREYYINDAGGQVDVLARSVYLRYLEASGDDIGEIPEGLYPADYLKPVGELVYQKYGDSLKNADELEWLDRLKTIALAEMMELIKSDLADLGIHHDVFASEKKLHESDLVKQSLEILRNKGLVYNGILEKPKGKLLDDWEEREQTLFASSKYGDDVDRALVKSDGSWTYFAADVAYANDKIKRGFDSLIMVLGADHGGYVKRMKAAVSALSDGRIGLDIQLCQLVKFMDNGVAIKMSKRSGNFTTVRDVVAAVGKDVVRFIMLTRKAEQPLDFDLTKVTEQSKDNPVFYVQYAHARCKSLLRMAEEQMPEVLPLPEIPTKEQLSLLSSEAELSLIRLLAGWSRIVEAAALSHEPHRIAYYLQDVAAEFHGFWNLGNNNSDLRFIINAQHEVTVARLSLAKAVSIVLASGLGVLGVEPLDEMR